MLVYLGYVLVKSKLKHPPPQAISRHLNFWILVFSKFSTTPEPKLLLYKYVHFRLSNVATSGTLEGDHVTLLNINVIFTMLAFAMTY